MTFICSICGEVKDDSELSHDDVCIYCDLNIMHDANIEDGQLF
jgi:hypothetical protein